MNKENEILKILSNKLKNLLITAKLDYNKLQELRLRVNEPFIIVYDSKEFFVNTEGSLTNKSYDAYIVNSCDIRDTLEFISNYSLYAYEDEIRQGFITIQGGPRVGIAGKVVMENGKIKSVRHISFINIRMSHQIKGCSDQVIDYVANNNQVAHTLIISPPRCGKTTLLRDLIRSLSNGENDRSGFTVGVIDERSEIGACFRGTPQNDVGIRTDILDCCPKVDGMLMLIRSMSPQIIAVDEIGSREDIEAIEYVINSGCKILATVHGNSIDDIKNKPVLRKLVEEKMFERYIVLNNEFKVGHIESVFDARGNRLYGDDRYAS